MINIVYHELLSFLKFQFTICYISKTSTFSAYSLTRAKDLDAY